MDKRREAWLIQQEREREHEIRKQKMILEYELKRAAMLGSKGSSEKFLHQSQKKSRSKSRDCECRDCNRPISDSKSSVMSRKLKSADDNTPLFMGPEGQKFNTTELRRIKVDIHRNIPGGMATSCELKRDIVNLEEVTLKRREDEGVKPLFDREELKLHEGTTNEEVEERRIVKTIDSERLGKTNHSLRRLSRSVSSSRSHRPSTSKDDSRHERSVHKVESNRRNWSSERNRSDIRDRSRGHERRHRSKDFTVDNSFHRSDDKNSLKRKSSRERCHYAERRHSSHQNRSSQSDRADEKRYRESRGRSREERKRERSLESRRKDRSRDGRMPTLPHYVEQVPVYYGNFPPRPIMMGPMMPVGGPWIRNSIPVRPRISFLPRFMPPHMYRPGGLPPNSRFS